MPQHPGFRVTPIAAAVATALYSAPTLYAQETSGQSVGLEEIIVTSRKRTESVMDIPASIQALTSEDLKAMNARGLSDYSRFIPSLNVITYGVGSSVVVFRGANVDSGGYVAQSTSSVYLDELSLSNTGEQPSVRMVDIERVEALSGPQGTLYGSDAQAGTMRIITNKPVMNELDIVTDFSARDGSQGESSHDASIVLNLPLIDDTLALRLVGFNAKDGGYIDNIFGHTPDTDSGGAWIPSGFGTLDNAHAVEDDWNGSTIDGWRAALRWDINEDWSTTFTALGQSVDSGALNAYDPFAGDLKVVKFDEEFRKDDYDMYSFVVEGDLGFAQLVSATSYFDRTVKTHRDNTAYNHQWAQNYCGVYESDPSYYPYYYAAADGSGVVWWPVYCMAPTINGDYLSAFDYNFEQDRFTQEFRLSSQGDTLDWIVGLFYEESNYSYLYDFAYPTANENTPYQGLGVSLYQESISLDYFQQYLGESFPNAKEYWFEQSSTDWKQTAVFGEAVWHVSDRVDITAGGRFFQRDNNNLYYEAHPSDNSAELDAGVPKHKGEEKEFLPKLALSYNLGDNSMVYALWTQGQRPGGTNRGRGEPALPQHYDPDRMTNTEIGFKSTFADGRARVALTAFRMDWEDYQLEIVDPSSAGCPADGPSSIPKICGQPWQNVVANGGDAEIKGLSIEYDWAPSARWVLGMNAEWLDAKTLSSIDLSGDGVDNVVAGQKLPISPEWAASAWATYTWPVPSIGGGGFARLQWSYSGETLSNIEASPVTDDNATPQFTNTDFEITDFSIGFENNTWEASFFVNNLTDERAQYQHSWGTSLYTKANMAEGRAHTKSIYTNRPRELGLRLIYHWGG